MCVMFACTVHVVYVLNVRLYDYVLNYNVLCGARAQFKGLWYEVERTRTPTRSQWQSPLLVINYDEFNQRFAYKYAGTMNGVCRGPVHAWADTSHLRDYALDVRMNLGQEEQSGNPWDVRCK